MKQPTEHAEQVAVVNWLRKQGIFVFSIPNERNCSAITGKLLKDAGRVKGVADLFIPKYKIFAELKVRKGGYQTKEQKYFEKLIKELGYHYILCNGAKDAVQKIKEYI